MFTVTKKLGPFPVAHCQFQDIKEDGSVGNCAALHGYDRSVSFTIGCTETDEYGWVYPFGHFKKIRKFLEYYMDHTSVIPANDDRINSPEFKKMIEPGQLLATARILPYGVSMEMSALFAYEQINGYVYETSGGRCAITHINFMENDINAGQLVVDFKRSHQIGCALASKPQLVEKQVWRFEEPRVAIERILG